MLSGIHYVWFSDGCLANHSHSSGVEGTVIVITLLWIEQKSVQCNDMLRLKLCFEFHFS